MPSIESRIDALAAELQRRAMLQAEPVDGLSQSLFDLQREFAVLDDVGKAALLEALNNPDDGGRDGLSLTMQNVERIIDDWRPR